jgi:hypothetical protein
MPAATPPGSTPTPSLSPFITPHENNEEKKQQKEPVNFKKSYLYWTFVRQTLQRINQKKISFCLGCGACFIVVLTVSLFVTIIANSPVVFLRLAELSSGEIDLEVWAGPWTGKGRVNYTTIAGILNEEGEEYSYHTARLRFGAWTWGEDSCDGDPEDKTWRYFGEGDSDPCRFQQTCFYQYCSSTPFTADLFIINSEAEKRMNLGREWPYEKLEPGTCLVQRSFAR